MSMTGATFSRGGYDWTCHVIENGNRYAWQAADDLAVMRVGRRVQAFHGAMYIGHFPTLVDAMDAAIAAKRRRAA